MVYIGRRKYKYGRMWLSHMAADTINELHTVAALLNLNRKWFQDKDGKPHYDVCQKKKKEALSWTWTDQIKEVDDREIIKLYKKVA